jgi:hypothetical protein
MEFNLCFSLRIVRKDYRKEVTMTALACNKNQMANQTILHIELLGFWTSSIIRYSRKLKTRSFENRISFRPKVRRGREDTYSTGPLKELEIAFLRGSTEQMSSPLT